MTTQQKLIFKNKEIIIKAPLTSDTLNLGEHWRAEAKVIMTGELQEKYNVGDTIWYLHAKGMENDRGRVHKVNGENIMIIEENRVICQVISE